MQIASIGIDLGKNTFHLVALDERSKVVIRQKFTRKQLLACTANLPSSLIGIEACSGAHFLGAALRNQGHDVRLIPAQFVKPFLKSNKNDFLDAEAIAEAVARQNMRFVPIKTDDQLDLQALHRIRDRVVHHRTAVINQIRGFLLERGITFAKGRGARPLDAGYNAGVMPGKRILLCTFGSLGDLYPILALAIELKRRGHLPVVATLPGYRDRVHAAGVRFHGVRPDIDVSDSSILPRAMHPRDGARYILCELLLPYLRESFEDTAVAAHDADLIVTHPVTLGAVLVARKTGMPWASVALSPVSTVSVYDMSVFPGLPVGEWLSSRGPGWQRLFLTLLETSFDRYWKPYHTFERELGLSRSRNPFLHGHSPQLALALFSPLFAAPQLDWPSNSHATGFPFLDQREECPSELTCFLEEGEAPIVFTLGSAAVGSAGDFYSISIEAVRRLRRRAVLLIGNDPVNRPMSKLPPDVIAVPYAPHAAVFPQACVNVHQGGIGTTAEALRAGRPMLVVPFSHDQPDNAYRLKKLGVARSIRRTEYNVESATREIDVLLRETSYTDRAATLGERIRAENGTATAVDLLEGLFGMAAFRCTS
jgi:rhamnosyltransferase subunit B